MPGKQINDGFTDISYRFGFSQEEDERVRTVLNEACHVFHMHAGGTWSVDKDIYASQLGPEAKRRPSLVKALLGTEDRVVRMVTYRAVERADAATTEPTESRG